MAYRAERNALGAGVENTGDPDRCLRDGRPVQISNADVAVDDADGPVALGERRSESGSGRRAVVRIEIQPRCEVHTGIDEVTVDEDLQRLPVACGEAP